MSDEVKTSAAAAELLAKRGLGDLADKMGIKLIELSAERSVATMPVATNTQPFGILHGGAHVVLAESLAVFLRMFGPTKWTKLQLALK